MDGPVAHAVVVARARQVAPGDGEGVREAVVVLFDPLKKMVYVSSYFANLNKFLVAGFSFKDCST